MLFENWRYFWVVSDICFDRFVPIFWRTRWLLWNTVHMFLIHVITNRCTHTHTSHKSKKQFCIQSNSDPQELRNNEHGMKSILIDNSIRNNGPKMIVNKVISLPPCLSYVNCEMLTSLSTILRKSIFYLRVLTTYFSKELRFLKSAS